MIQIQGVCCIGFGSEAGKRLVELAAYELVDRIDVVVVDEVGKRNQAGPGHAPAEAPGDDRIVCDIELLFHFFLGHLGVGIRAQNTWKNGLIFVCPESIINSIKFSAVFALAGHDLLLQQRVLELFDLGVFPAHWEVAEAYGLKVEMPERFFADQHVVQDEDADGVILRFEVISENLWMLFENWSTNRVLSANVNVYYYFLRDEQKRLLRWNLCFRRKADELTVLSKRSRKLNSGVTRSIFLEPLIQILIALACF